MFSLIDGATQWLQNWTPIISGIGSLALTAGLVILYRQQKELVRKEMNRDIRKGHTEVLRKRVKAWHGDVDELNTPSEGEFNIKDTNLPNVRHVTVDPAPSLVATTLGNGEFRVIPQTIKNDRYIDDLLENHAPDLKNQQERIRQQHAVFEEKRNEFVDAFSLPEILEEEAYIIRPKESFSKWVFNQAVKIHRDHVHKDKERLQELAEIAIKDSNRRGPDDDRLLFPGTPENRGEVGYTFEAISNSGTFEVIEENRPDIEKKVKEIHIDAIDDIVASDETSPTIQAAEILDNMVESIQKLEQLLVEYEGRQIYHGHCSYLEESEV